MIRLSGMALAPALALALGGVTQAAPPDGFAAFWPGFAAAAAKDDTKTLASMTYLNAEFGDSAGSFGKVHSNFLGAKARRCLATAKPTRDVDPEGHLSYGAFCGEVIYIFSKQTGAWKFSGVGAND